MTENCSAAYGPKTDLPAHFLMTVETTSIVDAVGTDTGTNEVHLSIFDHLPWSTDHLRLLQDKINAYLGYIESGEIYASYPTARGRTLVIDVFAKFRPSEDALVFFAKAEAVAAEYGASLRYLHSGKGYADDAA